MLVNLVSIKLVRSVLIDRSVLISMNKLQDHPKIPRELIDKGDFHFIFRFVKRKPSLNKAATIC